MRARWVILIAGGVLVLAISFVLFMQPTRPGQIAVQVQGRTNHAYTLLASNSTRYLHYVSAGAVTEGVWSTHIMQELPAHQSIAIQVFVPTNASRQIVFMYSRAEGSKLEEWFDRVRSMAGINGRQVQNMYIDIPE